MYRALRIKVTPLFRAGFMAVCTYASRKCIRISVNFAKISVYRMIGIFCCFLPRVFFFDKKNDQFYFLVRGSDIILVI